MSLQQLAQHMQSHGRGEDKMLVHMTPGEVGGLQSLAMAHGGSLTINPQTGLPEAGFLSKILPTIIGAGVGIATMNPMLGAAAGGAAGLAMSGGSLQAGLMAGLSSYGMGSLGAGLAGAGASAATAGAGAAGPALIESGTSGALGAAMEQGAMSAIPGSGVSMPSTWDNLRSGFGAVGEQPGGWGQFMKSNMLPIAGAAAPLLMGGMGGGGGDNTAPDSSGYIRPFDMQTQVNGPSYTPGTPYMTRTFTPQEPVKSGDWGSRAFNNGGIVALANGGSPNAANRYGVTGNTPLLAGTEQANQGIVGQTPNYLRPESNPSNIFGTAFNPYTPMGFQGFGQNRYGAPTAQTNMPVVDQYNQSLAEQANLEYMGQPTLAAFMSQQRKELERAYNDILKRAPDAASQKNYLEQMDQGATIDDIKTQMETNPPPVPTINPTIDATPAQTSVPSTLAPVSTSYGQPGAVEQSAVVNRQAVEQMAPIEAQRVAAQIAEPAPVAPPPAPVAPPPAPVAPPPPPPPPPPAPTGPTPEQQWAEQQRILEQQQAAERKRLADEAEAKRIADEEAAKKLAESARPIESFGGSVTTNYESGESYYTDPISEIFALDKMHGNTNWEGRPSDAAIAEYRNPSAATIEARRKEHLERPDENTSWYAGDGGANGGIAGVDFARNRYASGGGISNLGSYSDGGQLLKGPGDGVSDSIPAQIGERQPARLANNEFVIPARIVSEIGNGSTDAGAKQLYAMMDRIQKRRGKTVGKGKVAVDSKAYKELNKL